jgi:hypothetical protein
LYGYAAHTYAIRTLPAIATMLSVAETLARLDDIKPFPDSADYVIVDIGLIVEI